MAQTIALKVEGIFRDIEEDFQIITKEMQQKYKKYNYDYIKRIISNYECIDIFEAYTRPSQEKIRIFEKYKRINNDLIEKYGVLSYNCMNITLGGYTTITHYNLDGELICRNYYVYITKTKNLLIEA